MLTNLTNDHESAKVFHHKFLAEFVKLELIYVIALPMQCLLLYKLDHV